MSITRISVDLEDPTTFLEGRVDLAVVDGTTEAEIAAQQKEDEIEAMRDAAHQRAVRDDPRLGTGEARADWRGARAVAGARQGSGDRSSRTDLIRRRPRSKGVLPSSRSV